MRKWHNGRLLLIWRVLLLLAAADMLFLGAARYMAGYYVHAAYREFAAAAASWQPVATVPYADLINTYGQRFDVSPRLTAAVIMAESSFAPQAVSSGGAYGLMQVIPATWQHVNRYTRLCSGRHKGECSTTCYFEPELNIGIGSAYLKEMIDRFGGHIPLAVAAYNAGPAAVEHFGGIPPYKETRDYVGRVMDNWYGKQGAPRPLHDTYVSLWEKCARWAAILLLILFGSLILVALLLRRRCRSWRWR